MFNKVVAADFDTIGVVIVKPLLVLLLLLGCCCFPRKVILLPLFLSLHLTGFEDHAQVPVVTES